MSFASLVGAGQLSDRYKSIIRGRGPSWTTNNYYGDKKKKVFLCKVVGKDSKGNPITKCEEK
jgi:hypothetical protein